MITIQDVEKVFRNHPWLRPPKHVFFIPEDVEYETAYGKVLFRGLQPSWKPDVIILTPRATEETVIHETLHTYGLGEEPVHRLAPKILKFRKTIPALIQRKVRYKKCSGCKEFEGMHKLGAIHYVLET